MLLLLAGIPLAFSLPFCRAAVLPSRTSPVLKPNASSVILFTSRFNCPDRSHSSSVQSIGQHQHRAVEHVRHKGDLRPAFAGRRAACCLELSLHPQLAADTGESGLRRLPMPGVQRKVSRHCCLPENCATVVMTGPQPKHHTIVRIWARLMELAILAPVQ